MMAPDPVVMVKVMAARVMAARPCYRAKAGVSRATIVSIIKAV
jgi:hypothetical protein